MWEYAPGDLWRWILVQWRVLVSTNSTWRLIAHWHCQAPASEDVAEAEAPAEEQAATDDMCLGCSWVLQKDKCQVSDTAWECQDMPGSCCLNHAENIDTKSARVVVNDGKWQRLVWQHWLRMAAIPEGSWSRCDWKARCGRRWGSCKSYQESTKEFMFFFSASDMIENWEVATTMSCMGSQKVLLLVCDVQWKLHGILWNGILVRWCVVVELQLTGTRFWRCCRTGSTSSGASCCRWSVSWPLLDIEGEQCQGVGFRFRDTYRH